MAEPNTETPEALEAQDVTPPLEAPPADPPPEGADAGDGGPAGDPAAWHAAIKDKDAQKWAAKFADPELMALSALDMRKKLSKAINLPGEDATADEMAEFRKKLGTPEKVEDYTVELPEEIPEHLRPDGGDEGAARVHNKMLETMHAVGATQEQVQAIMGAYYGLIYDEVKQIQQETTADKGEHDNIIRKEWGSKYADYDALARHAAQRFGGEEFAQFIEENVPLGMFNHHIRRFLANVGVLTTEADNIVGISDGDARKSTQDQIDELMQSKAYTNSHHPDHNKVQEQVATLFSKLHGSGVPVVGGMGVDGTMRTT